MKLGCVWEISMRLCGHMKRKAATKDHGSVWSYFEMQQDIARYMTWASQDPCLCGLIIEKAIKISEKDLIVFWQMMRGKPCTRLPM